MEALIGIAIWVVPTLFFIFLGLGVGTWTEKRHFRNLNDREQQASGMVESQSKLFIEPYSVSGGQAPPMLICAETAVASDYFKNFLSAFRKFFGGEMRSYNSLMERARRETLMRLKEQARAGGYNAICNVRLEPADVGGTMNKKAAVMVCILGSATAYHSQLSKDTVNKPVYTADVVSPPVKPTE